LLVGISTLMTKVRALALLRWLRGVVLRQALLTPAEMSYNEQYNPSIPQSD
jgi:hypothetical protein